MERDPELVIATLLRERDELKEHCERLRALAEGFGYPPGHFYSPVVDTKDPDVIAAVRGRLAAGLPKGIAVDAARMERTMESLAVYGAHFPFPKQRSAGFRYYSDNPYFGIHDAVVWYGFLRQLRPRPRDRSRVRL